MVSSVIKENSEMYVSSDGKVRIILRGGEYHITLSDGEVIIKEVSKVGRVETGKTVTCLLSFSDPEDADTYYAFYSDGTIMKAPVFRKSKDMLDPEVAAFFEQVKVSNAAITHLVTKTSYNELLSMRVPSREIIAECVSESEAESAAARFGGLCIVLDLNTFDFSERWANH